jgi:2-iminobutanoate/2-iminopropanoate deaminase
MTRKNYTAYDVSASGPYSHAIDAGDFIFLSGQTAMNGVGDEEAKVKGNITDQTKTALAYLTSVMDAAEVTSDDVVKVNVYLTSMAYFDEMNEVYKTFFNEPYPARTCVAVNELPLEADVEIEFIVKKSN